jgi:TolB-like protein/DNA-binding winged helix-turn-helix (wHTH) protein/Flp pilus assembly protein TadD
MKSFKAFRLDRENHILWRNEDRVPMAPKEFDILAYLVEHAGRVVTQDQILDALWSETYVNPEVLRKYILEIRKTLGDRPENPEFIETVPKRGYRFVASVANDNGKEPAVLSASHEAEQKVVEEKVRPETALSKLGSLFAKRKLLALSFAGLATVAVVGLGGYLRSIRSVGNTASMSSPSIAVLPFTDVSPAKDQEYFSDGLSEQLINDLAQVSGLKVVGRSSSFQFKDKNEDLRVIGKKLGVANVLEGSVCRQGNHVRITAELTKADDGFQLWSQTYDREIKDIFAAQDEIARAVTGTLQVKLLSPNRPQSSPGTRSANPEAYQAYLQGQYFAARGQDERDLNMALSYADQAIKLDANYASAWAQRSLVLQSLTSGAFIENVEGFHRARESAKKAIALDPNLADGYLAMALVQIDHDWDWDGAEVSLKRAELLEPGSADVIGDRAYLARSVATVNEAIELYKQAIALDPLSANFHWALAYQLYMVGRYGDAEAELQRAQELNPQLPFVHATRGMVLSAEGRQQEALAEMETDAADWAKLTGEALTYFAIGRREESERALNKLIAVHQNDCAYQVAEVYAYRGESDKAFAWLDRAYRQRDPEISELRHDPLVGSLRHDPRFTALVTKMRLPN